MIPNLIMMLYYHYHYYLLFNHGRYLKVYILFSASEGTVVVDPNALPKRRRLPDRWAVFIEPEKYG